MASHKSSTAFAQAFRDTIQAEHVLLYTDPEQKEARIFMIEELKSCHNREGKGGIRNEKKMKKGG